MVTLPPINDRELPPAQVAAPPRYYNVQVPLAHGSIVWLTACRDCGGLIIDKTRHDQFHEGE